MRVLFVRAPTLKISLTATRTAAAVLFLALGCQLAEWAGSLR